MIKDFKNSLRLITVFIFMLFQLPSQFRFIFRRSSEYSSPSIDLHIFLLVCFVLFISLEILEFKKWNYRYKSPRIPRILFLIRLIIFLVAVHLEDLKFIHPGTSLYIILLVFYAYYAFPFWLSLGFCIMASSSVLYFDILRRQGQEGFSQIQLFYGSYKSLIMVIFYLFAFFWEKDRDMNDENIKLLDSLNKSEKQLREYAAKIGTTVALEERTRLARDIHDSVGHALTGIQIQLSKAEAYYELDKAESIKAVQVSREAAAQAMQDIRSSLGMLNNEKPGFSLETDISPLLVKLESPGVKVDFNWEGDYKGYNYAVLLTLYRIVQEGVTNILKHADAREVSLKISFKDNVVEIILIDDGKGFDTQKIQEQLNGHFGLHGMQQRIELVRGQMMVRSEPEGGTTIKAVLPRNPVALIGEENE